MTDNLKSPEEAVRQAYVRGVEDGYRAAEELVVETIQQLIDLTKTGDKDYTADVETLLGFRGVLRHYQPGILKAAAKMAEREIRVNKVEIKGVKKFDN